MATINLGAIKFKWQGAYSAGTAYTVDDVVSYNGSSYICILASTGNLPTNATYWEQMSAKGTDGTNGTNGTNGADGADGADGTDLTTTLTTQGDIVYRNASGLARLGAGTSGQVLQTGGTGANPSWVDVGGGFSADTLLVVKNNFTSGTTVDLNGYKSFHAHVFWQDATITTKTKPNIALLTTNVSTGGTGASSGTGWGYFARVGNTTNNLDQINTSHNPDTSNFYSAMNSDSYLGWWDLKVDGLFTNNLSINTVTKTNESGLYVNHFWGLYNGTNTSTVRYLRFNETGQTHFIKYIKVIGYK